MIALSLLLVSLVCVEGSALAEEAGPAEEAALAEQIAPPEGWSGEAVVAEPPPETLEEVWARMDPRALLDEAIARRGLGDFEGADARFALLRERDETALVVYQSGLSMEFQERFDQALADYDAVIARWPDADVVNDARFRRALVLDDLGRHTDSLDQVRELEKLGHWPETDRLTLELERGVSELRSGKARKGIPRIEEALAELDGSGDQSWMRGKARVALARYLLDQAREIRLAGNRKAARRLAERARLLSQAERQVAAVTELSEPEHILDGLLILGDGYLDLHDEMLAAPPPRSLDETQRGMYTDMVAERAGTLRSKAWAYYDEGVKLGARTQWQGEVVRTLRARRDALQEGR